MKKLIFLFFCLTTTAKMSFAQQRGEPPKTNTNRENKEHYCSTDLLHNALNKESASYAKKFKDMNLNWEKWALKQDSETKSQKANKGGGVTTQSYHSETLPVIFHMMINSTTSPVASANAADANLTKAQIQTALTNLNQLFAGTAVGSKAAGLNTDIQFCLAEVDKFGAGITSYTYTNPLPGTIGTLDNTSQGQINQLSNIVQNTGKFPPTKYINIYVVEDITSPVAGFAFLPSAHGSSFDGIYIEAQYLLAPLAPHDLSYNMTVLTHEMGHYLGMFHTFGICNAPLIQACSCDNNNCLFNGDMVCDTPPDFSQGSLACTTPTNTCHTDASATVFDNLNLTADVNDLTDNYMDYGNWDCQHNFTIGQRKRMHFMIDEFVGPRNSLLHSSVCNTVCVNTTCTVTIASPTATVNGVNLPNTLILAGPAVANNFTATMCGSVYNTWNWSAINLATNAVMLTGTAANFNVNFTAIGNYRILLRASIAGSNPLCFQTDTLDIQVLPPPICPANLDMSGGWNSNNWQRIQYEGGWARTANNASTFTFPTTTLTMVPPATVNGTANTDPFSMVTTLSADPNFSSLNLPAGVTSAMRVGKLVTAATTLPAGDAAYVTYTFSPTEHNAKLRVYYLGMKEQDALQIQYPYNFAVNASGGSKTTFGFVCNYDFASISNAPAIAHRGLTHTGTSGTLFGKNDLIAGGMHCPVTPATFSTATIGTKTFDQMTSWQFMDLDFSEFICASPTITVTFFARSDNASNLGFHHSYSYFAAQCLPATFKDIDLNLKNFDIACAANVGQSCATEILPIPSVLSHVDNGGSYHTYQDMLDVDVEESNDNITYTPVSLFYNYQFSGFYATPILNLCKSPDGNPYKYYRIVYRTLCQTMVDTVSIFQGFVHNINACAPNPMTGGSFINPPIAPATYSPDKYVQYCTSATLTLTPPCWWQPGDPEPEYKWQRYSSWLDIPGATSASLTVNETWNNCTPYRRVAKFNDPYCNVPTWVPSDVFSVTSFQANNFNYNIIGPDVCGNSPATINISNLYENFASCDLELATQATLTPTQNTITLSFFSNSSCTPASSLTATSGPSTLVFLYQNSLLSYSTNPNYSGPINTTFTFNNNGIYTTTGNAYIVVNVTRYGCVSSFTLPPVTIKIKPSAIAGTITPAGSICTSTTIALTGDNPNSFGYTWEYSYNSAFSPLTVFASSNNFAYTVPVGTFTSYPVYVRRKALGTTDCPNPAYSNTLTILNTAATLTISASSSTICAGSSVTLTASGASTYTWMPGNTTGNPKVFTPASTTVYSVTGTTAGGCVGTKTITITVVPLPTINIAASSATVCEGANATFTATGATSYTWMPGSVLTSTLSVYPLSTTVYTVTGQNASGCKSTKTVTITTVAPPKFEFLGSSSQTICAGSNATITASGSGVYTYTWMPGSMSGTSVIVSPSSTTVYTVTSSNGSPCYTIKTVTVNVLPTPTVAITGNTIICLGSTTTLTASGGGTYSWSTGSPNASIVTALGGVYTVTVTSGNGCKAVKTVTTVVGALPSFTVSPLSSTICAGTSLTLTAGGALSYTWMPGSTNGNTLQVTPTTTTIYTVTGKNKSICVSTRTAIVNVLPVPVVSITGNTVICSGTTTTLTASGGGTYLWSLSNMTGSQNASVVVGVSGINTVTVTGANGCQTVASQSVTVIPTPYVEITTPASTVCPGECITLYAEQMNAMSMTWSTMQNGTPTSIGYGTWITVCPTVTTTYSITGSVKKGCFDQDAVTISVYNNDPAFNLTSTQLSGLAYYTCTATPVYVSSSYAAGINEMYIVEEISPTTSVTIAGTNSSQGTNPNPSCWWVYPNPLTFTGYNGTQNVATCPASGPYADGQFTNDKTYRITRGTWNNGCPWAQKSRIVYQSGLMKSSDGQPQIVVVEDNNAPDYSYLVYGSASAAPIKNNNINVFPNPTNGLVNIVLDEATAESYTVEVFDMFGKLVYTTNETNKTKGKFLIQLDLEPLHLVEGIYMINVNSPGMIYSKKIRLE